MLHDEDTEKEAKKGKGDEMRHKEINRKRGKVPKDVHCVLQPKGKEKQSSYDKYKDRDLM